MITVLGAWKTGDRDTFQAWTRKGPGWPARIRTEASGGATGAWKAGVETGMGVSLRTGSLGRRGRDGVSGYRLLLSRRQDTVRAPRRPVQTLLSQRDGRRRPTSEGDRNRGGRLGHASARGPGGGGLRSLSPSRPGPPSSRLAAGVHPKTCPQRDSSAPPRALDKAHCSDEPPVLSVVLALKPRPPPPG